MSLPADLGFYDAGLLVWMYEYGHLLRWSGARWEWGPGDPGSGYFMDFALAPTGPGWQLCDGTVTDYLSLNPIPGAVAFTTPNENANATYHRSAAAYTGTINAPIAPTLTGAPSLSGNTGAPSATVAVQSGAGTTVATDTHTHGVGSLAAGLGTLAAGTNGEPQQMDVLRYFRR